MATIEVIARESINTLFTSTINLSSLGSSIVFPDNLDNIRYLTIQVYSPNKNKELNTALSASTSAVVTAGNDAFKSLSDADSIGSFVTGLKDAIVEGAKALVTVIPTGVEALKQQYKSVANNLISTGDLSNAKLTSDWIDNLYLPLPNELAESMSHVFAEKPGWADAMIPGSRTLGEGVQEKTAILASATGQQALVYDENKIQMYQSSAFRIIDLSWTLTPHNAPEAKKLQEIVRRLKMYSSPRSQSGKLLLEAPHFFKLSFGNEVINNALQFNEVVLTSVSVAYSPGSSLELFHDGMPKSVQLGLSFKDREPKLASDWDKKFDNASAAPEASCPAS